MGGNARHLHRVLVRLLWLAMNPARTFGPNLVSTDFTGYWVYIAGPLAGAVLAVIIAFVLRGPGGGKSGSGAAQGDIFTETYQAGKS